MRASEKNKQQYMRNKSKGVRLFKVLKELNVARDTLVSHLKSEGFDIADTGPNARLTPEMYDKVLEAFAKEKKAAVRHEQRVQELLRRRTADDDGYEDDEYLEEISAPAPAPVAVEPPVEAKPEPIAEEPEPIVEAEPEPIVEVEVEEAPIAEEPEPVVEAEPEPIVEVEVEEAPIAEEPEPVVEAEPEPIVEVEVEEAPIAEEPEPVVEVEVEEAVEDVAAEEEVDESTITADRYTLSGPKILGKVDLTSVDESSSKRKRKRKRKRKGEADKPETDTVQVQEAKTDRDAKKRRRKRKKTPAVDQSEVQSTVQKTLQDIEKGGGAGRERSRRRRRRREEHAAKREIELQEAEAEAGIIKVLEFITANDLASELNVQVTDVIRACLELGMMVSINQRLDADTISLIAEEFGQEVEFLTEIGLDDVEIEEDALEDLESRPPVVTVMGHVDHGKTSLLDYVRSTNVVAGESGGITQHIGAYAVQLKDGREIGFLDTPGHEAFTAMRARGAQVTDVVILVVAADDAVMPQTIEAINHAKAAGVPIVVAVNKIDKPGANTPRVMQQLADHDVLVEQYGGKVQCSLVSAKTGEGIDDLMEKVLLEAEVLELKANPNREAVGTVIESRLDKGRGTVATILVQNGTLRVGNPFIAGAYSGKVRAMFDERDHPIESVGPAEPALVLGFSGAPEVGDRFIVMEDERMVRDIAQKRQQIQREQVLRRRKHITLDDIGRRLALGDFQELNLIVKADVGGSAEALTDSLLKLSTEEVQVNIIHRGVGAITETDIMLASASDAVIIGFHVRPMPGVRQLAEQEEIDIRLYSIIYDAIEDVRDALEGLLSPELSEKTLGLAEVREIFRVPKVGVVAGCYVLEGKINRNDKVRLVRDGIVIYEGRLGSLKRFKDDVREVVSGYECGMSIEGYNDIKVSDQIEAYEVVETKRQLQV